MIGSRIALALLAAVLLATNARAQSPPVIPDWNGFYAGLSIGSRRALNDWTSIAVSPQLPPTRVNDPLRDIGLDSTAGWFGFYFGHNWIFSESWLVGLEATVGYANNKSGPVAIPGTNQTDNDDFVLFTNRPTVMKRDTWDVALSGRLGQLITPSTLVFMTSGPAMQYVSVNAFCSSPPVTATVNPWCSMSYNETYAKFHPGWTIGGGIEHMIGDWILRLSYRYSDYGSFTHTFFRVNPITNIDDRITARIAVRTHLINFGLAYRLGRP